MGKRGSKPKRNNIVWSPEIAYAVGLMATDGCLSNDGRHIDLTSKDEDQLRNFMRCIGKNVPITYKRSGYTQKSVTRIQFSDVVLYDFLISVGMTPNKTKTLGELNIPDALFFDFLRGHLDGDGCFYSYFDPRWKSSFMYYLTFISASERHLIWVRNTIMRLSGVRGHMTRTGRKGQEIRVLRYAKSESRVLCNLMYANPGSICLLRKRLKISTALGIVGLTLPSGGEVMPR